MKRAFSRVIFFIILFHWPCFILWADPLNIIHCFVLQEENSRSHTCILTPVKEEVIKPEITIEEDMLVVHNDSLGLDHFLKLTKFWVNVLRYVQVIWVASDDCSVTVPPHQEYKQISDSHFGLDCLTYERILYIHWYTTVHLRCLVQISA